LTVQFLKFAILVLLVVLRHWVADLESDKSKKDGRARSNLRDQSAVRSSGDTSRRKMVWFAVVGGD
jgi:hypothetical protein